MVENFILIRYDETPIRGSRFIHGICELIIIYFLVESFRNVKAILSRRHRRKKFISRSVTRFRDLSHVLSITSTLSSSLPSVSVLKKEDVCSIWKYKTSALTSTDLWCDHHVLLPEVSLETEFNIRSHCAEYVRQPSPWRITTCTNKKNWSWN